MNPRYVSTAKKIKEVAPKVFEEVRQSKTTIPKAVLKVTQQAERERRVASGEIPAAPPSDEECAAYHVAGRAVVGYILGLDIDSVDPRYVHYCGGDGKTSPTPNGDSLMRRRAGRIAVGKLLGGAAPADGDAAYVTSKELEQVCLKVAAGLSDPAATALPLGLEARGHYSRWLDSLLRDLLNHPSVWAAVQSLATAVLESGKLTGQAATAAVVEHVGRLEGRPWA